MQKRSKGERLRMEDFYGAESSRNPGVILKRPCSSPVVNAGGGLSPAHKQDLYRIPVKGLPLPTFQHMHDAWQRGRKRMAEKDAEV